jgi:hypothetical protein
VDGNSAVGVAIDRFAVAAEGLTATQKTDVNAEADTAISDFFTTLDGAALQQIVDDLENGGRLDLLIDAIKAKTDQFNFGVANKVDANVTHVNETEVTGNGGTGTEWGPV